MPAVAAEQDKDLPQVAVVVVVEEAAE